ncbi:nuclear transport factor 2 family protein [Streptomyces aurantiacus]|uniref:SnoaL-like domain-containing protein n=1 Tax=Streptomyces aurantiacus TaxID=47760 RepID=A0A7G1P552_9ACTN|nr:hypothetical protein GCM10017557_53370 [Streptomyces aurantiacus]
MRNTAGEAAIRRTIDVLWTRGEVNRCTELIHPEYRLYDPWGRPLGRGIDWYINSINAWRALFPGGTSTAIIPVSSGCNVSWHWNATVLVPREALQPPLREMSDEIPELRVLRFQWFMFTTLSADGRIIEEVSMSDRGELHQQIGTSTGDE